MFSGIVPAARTSYAASRSKSGRRKPCRKAKNPQRCRRRRRSRSRTN